MARRIDGVSLETMSKRRKGFQLGEPRQAR